MTTIDTAMHRHFPSLGYILCEWARVMTSARTSTIPAVKADRLRAAAEYRQEMARRLATPMRHWLLIEAGWPK